MCFFYLNIFIIKYFITNGMQQENTNFKLVYVEATFRILVQNFFSVLIQEMDIFVRYGRGIRI